jgi:hypothetical protein
MALTAILFMLGLSLGYGISGPMIIVAALSLALNLVLTGAFIAIVKTLLQGTAPRGQVLPNGG